MTLLKNALAVLLLLFFIGACTFPFTTATYKWKIKWDKGKLEFKEKYLAQDLPEHSDEKPPNVLFIVIDDLGKFEVSAYGSVTMKTPHIDQLASEGVLFTDCYVNSPVCSPSRAGLLTGRYPQRFGFETQPMEMYPNSLAVYAIGKYLMNTGDFVMETKPKFPPEWQMVKQGVPPTEMNLAEILKMRNYNTACIGKWHLGMSKELIPNSRGFDQQYGFYGAFTLYTKKRNSPNMVNYKSDSFSYKHQWKMGRKETSAIRRDDKVIKEDRYLTFAILEEGLSFMAANMNKPDPFFLYLAFNAAHYHAMIHALDDAIGSLMEKMKLLGLDENTVIYFISDNGGASYTGATTNFPYKGGKLTMFEGGVNVPFIMKWKGHIPEGLVYDKPVSSMDIYKTTVDIAECPLPNDRVFDGVNLVPYLNGKNKSEPHEAFYWRADHIHAMRKGDYKYLLSTRDNWAEVYKISEDKYEEYDLNKEQPEIIKQLQKDFDEWQKGLMDPLWPRIMDHKIEVNGKAYLFPA